MFWIGLIAGGIIGFAAAIGYSISLAVKECGSIDKAADVGHLISEANENRRSTICAYHDDKLLNYVVFEENE